VNVLFGVSCTVVFNCIFSYFFCLLVQGLLPQSDICIAISNSNNNNNNNNIRVSLKRVINYSFYLPLGTGGNIVNCDSAVLRRTC
jgi:hypothetical protein